MSDFAGTFFRQIKGYFLFGALVSGLGAAPLGMPPTAQAQPSKFAQLKAALQQGDCPRITALYKTLGHKRDAELLLLTVQARNIHALQSLLEAGANLNEASQTEKENLLGEAIWLRDKATVKLVQANGGQENNFMQAALGNLKAIDKLIASTPEIVRKTDRQGRTLMHWAALDGQTVIINKLLKAGAALDGEPKLENRRAKYDATPLTIALDNNCLSAAQLLLDKGAAAQGRAGDTKSPLHAAAHMANLKMMERLLSAGADINALDREGETALHKAAATGDSATCQFLIEHGCALEHTSKRKIKGKWSEEPALTRAVIERHEDIALLLIKAGADINRRNDRGLTPLMVAATRKDRALCQLLIDNRADKNAVNRQNKTAGEMLPADATNDLKAILQTNPQ